MKSKTTFKFGPSWFIYLVTIIFVLAKIFGLVDFNWWWVFSPIWISGLLAVFFLCVMLLIALIIEWRDRR